MNTLIIYASTHGTTAHVATLIWEHLDKKRTHIVHVTDVSCVDFDEYDTVILGSSIHGGINQKSMRDFCTENMHILLAKRLGLYLCSLHEGDEAIVQLERAYPQLLRKHAKSCMLMGGEIKKDKMNLYQLIRFQMFVSSLKSVFLLKNENIQNFVKEMQRPNS